MARYRATLAHNVRAYRYKDFEAADDAQAIEKAKLIDEWDPLETDSQDFDEGSITDKIVMLDAIEGEDEHNRSVSDEITLDHQRPYGLEARRFVEQMAGFSTYGDGPGELRFAHHWEDAVITINRMILKARELCGPSAAGKDDCNQDQPSVPEHFQEHGK